MPRRSSSRGVAEAQKLLCVAEVQALMEGMGEDGFAPSHPSLPLDAGSSINGLCCRSHVPGAPGRGRARQPAWWAAGQETPSCKQVDVKAKAGGCSFILGWLEVIQFSYWVLQQITQRE